MNHYEALGCIPYLYYYISRKNAGVKLSFHSLIPLFVAVNGFQYHILFSEYTLSRIFDILCGLYIVAYVNYYTSLQPLGYITTAFATTIYISNLYIDSGIVHVLLVQQPFLLYYAIAPVPDKNKILFNYDLKIES